MISNSGSEKTMESPITETNARSLDHEASRSLRRSHDEVYANTKMKPDVTEQQLLSLSGSSSDPKLLDADEASPPILKQSISVRLDEAYFQELLALGVSALALLSIVLVLRMYQHKPNPTSFSINAVISALATIAGLGCVHAAGSSISQLKWVWIFGKARRVDHFSLFDKGSRGELGATQAMIEGKFRFGNMAMIGMAAMLLRMGLEPSLQNMFSFVEADILDIAQDARLGIAVNDRAIGSFHEYESAWPDPELRASVLATASKFGKVNATGTALFSCASGNCEWDRYTTLAIHPECDDLSSQLVANISSSQPDTFYSLPETLGSLNLTLNQQQQYGGLTEYDSSYYSADRLDDGSIVAIYVGVDGSRFGQKGPKEDLAYEKPVFATKCTLQWAVRSMSASVKDGFYAETIHDTWLSGRAIAASDPYISSEVSATTPGQAYANLVLKLPDHWGSEKGASPDQVFTTFDESMISWNTTTQQFLPTYTLTGSIGDTDGQTAIYFQWNKKSKFVNELDGSEILRAMFFATFDNRTCDNPENNFECAFKATAETLTNTIRSSDLLANGTNAQDVAMGRVYRRAIIVEVDFRWMTLPAVVWLLCALATAGAMAKTRRTALPVWRDSLVPLLYLLRETDLGDELPENYARAALAKSNGVQVKLEKLGTDLQFRTSATARPAASSSLL